MTTSPESEPIPQSEKPGKAQSATRRKSNIARLPKVTRDQINQALDDGLSYRAIIERLRQPGEPELPFPISERNISTWKDTGYEDWLADQSWREDTRARQESAASLLDDFDATQVNHAALQLGTLHIFDALRNLVPGGLDQKLGGDATAFSRLLNSLSRASRETMQLQKYREACNQARALLQTLRDPNRKLNEDETRAIVLQVDHVLGLPRLGVTSPVPHALEKNGHASGPKPESPPPVMTSA